MAEAGSSSVSGVNATAYLSSKKWSRANRAKEEPKITQQKLEIQRCRVSQTPPYMFEQQL